MQNAPEFDIGFLTEARLLQNSDTVKKHAASLYPTTGSFWSAICALQYPEIQTSLEPFESPNQIWDVESSPFLAALLENIDLPSLPDQWKYSPGERTKYSGMVHEGLATFRQSFPTTFAIYQELVPHLIFVRRKGYGGASISSRIGHIWLSPSENDTATDLGENILHEFVHNALFLEDMVDTVFPYSAVRMAEPDGLALSAVRRVKRGYDKAYHSAFVAYAIVQYYIAMGDWAKAANVHGPLMLSVADLIKNTKMLSKNGIKHLEQLRLAVLKQHRLIETNAVTN